MTDTMRIGDAGESPVLADFLKYVTDMEVLDVLELGTKRSEPERATHHRDWLPRARRYTMSDVEDGVDVDVVADAHHLRETFASGEFNVAIAVSVWEHLRQPWEAAASLREVIRAGGYAYVCTHQTFPIHGYPSDYFRFTTDALASCMEWGGFTTLSTCYMYPCRIIPPGEVTRWNEAAPSFLNVEWYGRAKL